MKLKFGWNRRSFLAALGTLTGGMFAPSELNAALFGKKHKASARALDGSAVVPITTGLGSTGDIYAELGVTPMININGTHGDRRFGNEAGGHGTDSHGQ